MSIPLIKGGRINGQNVLSKPTLLNNVYNGISRGSIGIINVPNTIRNNTFSSLNFHFVTAYPASKEDPALSTTETIVTIPEFIYDLINLPFSITIVKLNNDGSSGINFGGNGIEIFAVLSKPTLTIQMNGAIRMIPKNNSNTKLIMFVMRSCCLDRKSTRLNSSHVAISYAVF